MQGKNLDKVSEFRDLGVVMDARLSFSQHINKITNEAAKTLGFIIRNSRDFQDKTALQTLYNSYVRSKLEYCFVIWNPYYNKYIAVIEKIQKRFLRYSKYIISGTFCNDNYTHLLQEFDFMRLETRRKVGEVLYLYKIINNRIDDAAILGLIELQVPHISTRFYLTFGYKCPRTNYKKFSPLLSMLRNYNSVQNVCDIFSDKYNKFKFQLVNFLALS